MTNQSTRQVGGVLGDDGEATHLGVRTPHAFYRRLAAPHRMVGAPGEVHVHTGDAPRKVKGLQHAGKLLHAQSLGGWGMVWAPSVAAGQAVSSMLA